MCHCGQLLFLSSNDRPVQSLDLAASYFALCPKFQVFPSRYTFENVENRTKTDSVTLMALKTVNLSKILML